MVKLGLLIAQFNEIEFIKDCLKPWIEFREKNPGKLVIACLDSKFLENERKEPYSTDGSLEYLTSLLNTGKIDYFTNTSPTLKEHEARNIGLKYLLSQNIDYLLTWGSDEIIKIDQIPLIYKYVEKEPLIPWFRISYKNFYQDKGQYILGFKPPRVFKIDCGEFKLDHFYWDDDIYYKNNRSDKTKDLKAVYDGNIISGQEPDIYRKHWGFASKIIPNLLVDHYTWLNGPRSVAKVDYQRKHFGHCSYTYNDKGEIFFDLEYYRKTGDSIPEIYTLEHIHS